MFAPGGGGGSRYQLISLLAGLPVMDDQEHDADERDTDEHHDEIPDGHGGPPGPCRTPAEDFAMYGSQGFRTVRLRNALRCSEDGFWPVGTRFGVGSVVVRRRRDACGSASEVVFGGVPAEGISAQNRLVTGSIVMWTSTANSGGRAQGRARQVCRAAAECCQTAAALLATAGAAAERNAQRRAQQV
jgi:hypothetical protein